MKGSGYRRAIVGMFKGAWKQRALLAEARLDATPFLIVDIVSQQWREYAGEVIDPVYKGQMAAWKVMDEVDAVAVVR